MIKLFLEIVRNNLFKYEMSDRKPVLVTGKSRLKISNLKKKLHVREMYVKLVGKKKRREFFTFVPIFLEKSL